MSPRARRTDHLPSQGPPPGGGLWAVGFVILTLLALAAVPAYLGDRMVAAQREIAEVLVPAGSLSSRISLLKARQIARIEGFLLTGDPSFRAPYVQGIAEEDSVYARLSALSRGLDLAVRERLALLSSESTRWHIENQRVFDLVLTPEEASATGERIRREFDALERGTRELDRAIQAEVSEGFQRMGELRRIQARITMALSVLALCATLVVGFVAVRLRGLTAEAESRRRDAVRARREIDALLEGTGDGVLGIDLEGRCTALNRVGSQLLGHTEREIVGRDVHEAIHHTLADGTPRPRERSPLLAGIREGTPVESGEGDVLWRRDGTAVPARWSLRPLVDGIERVGAVLTFTDMTEIREKEEALRRAIRQREDVISIVSHDLRNPLGVVFGASDLLLEVPLDPEQRRHQVEIIQRSARRMRSLIEDLLDVARIEEGAFVIRRSLEDLADILGEATDLFADQARQAGVSLHLVVPSPGPRARVDRDRVLQALANLLDNALRFTPKGGRIILGAVEVEGRVLVRVSDSGRGIPPERLGHLWDRFWQSDEAPRGGAGLGLAIVKGVAEAHGGRVSVSSEVGVGTTFILDFPGDGIRSTALGGRPSSEGAAPPRSS